MNWLPFIRKGKGRGNVMNYRKAQIGDAKIVTDLVQRTKAEIYPCYYPREVVEFFGELHCYEHILRDIEKSNVYVLEADGLIVGTGSFEENHVTRLYVLPEYEGKGYGSYILNELERAISKKYSSILLDASLPACRFYESKGYRTVRHEEYKCKKGAVLVYDIMEKQV